MNSIAKFVFPILLVLCGFAQSSNATITINFSSGDLVNQNGIPMPVNGLLELVADTSMQGEFAAPTADSFVNGDDVIVARFALNGNLTGNGVAGQTANALTIDPTQIPGLKAGDPLLFRWFPSLTASSSAPGTGTMYGQFNNATNQDGSNLDMPWTEPADGNSYTLNFVTMSEGGSNANSLGYADMMVVPEPSTPLMLGIAILMLLILKHRIHPKHH